MNRRIALAVFALLASSSLAQSRFALDIHRANVTLTAANDLQLHCSVSVPIEACTEILGLRLDCRCRLEQGRWVLAGSAQMIPYMYLSSPRWKSHEEEHLDDLRQRTEAYFADLESRTFDSEQSCRDEADFESAVFSLRMDLFRHRSNEKLH
jgi:hypothetical protein